VWNTVLIGRLSAKLGATDADLARVSPLAHRHVIPSDTYHFDAMRNALPCSLSWTGRSRWQSGPRLPLRSADAGTRTLDAPLVPQASVWDRPEAPSRMAILGFPAPLTYGITSLGSSPYSCHGLGCVSHHDAYIVRAMSAWTFQLLLVNGSAVPACTSKSCIASPQ
jgi:hypothetical protein